MVDSTARPIKAKVAKTILQSLRAGVTPRIGIQHIQVGRNREVESLLRDIEQISDGGTAFRLVIGDFGSGKSFFLHLIRSVALEKGLVTVSADLSPVRRLASSSGQALGLYAELIKNMSTRTKQDGNALTSVVEKFITRAQKSAKKKNISVNAAIQAELRDFSELVGGYDFANVIAQYWQGYKEEDETLKQNAVRWLRGEYTSKLDARAALGVRNIISDTSFYDYLKLMAMFVKRAGYKGLLVNLDEMVNLYKIINKQSRTNNYEQILRILNDCLQGGADHIGFLLGGTNEFLIDANRGLFSYPALESRLAGNQFADQTGLVDYNATVLTLPSLSPEEMYVLLTNVRHVQAMGNPDRYLVPDSAIYAFLDHCNNRVGAAYYQTPRNTVKAFGDLLAVLEQYPDSEWTQLIESSEVTPELNTDMPDDTGMPMTGDIDANGGEDLGSFQMDPNQQPG